MKKIISVFVILVCLICLCYACVPASGVPYKIWKDWDEMKEALGDDYLYPAYLPEFTSKIQNISLSSYFNHSLKENDNNYYYTYNVAYHSSDYDIDRFYFNAYNPYKDIDEDNDLHKSSPNYEANPPLEIYNESSSVLYDIEIKFATLYRDFDEVSREIVINERSVWVNFIFNNITYSATLTQYNVDDKYADENQREELLKVAKSIIEQKEGDK